jgi:hypothetical protein
MPATGPLANIISDIASKLSAAGLKPVTDPRNARPLTVMIGLPTFTSFTTGPVGVYDVTVKLYVLAPPPGNQDATDYLLTTVDTICGTGLAVVDGESSLITVGSQELPAYDLTIRVGSQ